MISFIILALSLLEGFDLVTFAMDPELVTPSSKIDLIMNIKPDLAQPINGEKSFPWAEPGPWNNWFGPGPYPGWPGPGPWYNWYKEGRGRPEAEGPPYKPNLSDRKPTEVSESEPEIHSVFLIKNKDIETTDEDSSHSM